MKVYTRTGDEGSTSLCGPERALKDDLRIRSYGTVDELSSILGWCRAVIKDEVLDKLTADIQRQLFVLGTDLATPGTEEKRRSSRVSAADVEHLEKEIDYYQEQIPPLKHFLLPSGCELACRFHMSRVVCRRAERRVVSLSQGPEINPVAMRYLNRLSDLLFVLARYANLKIASVCEEVV